MYVQANKHMPPSLGVDPVQCDEGEEWDWNAMACVTAGQAVTPTPPIPSIPMPQLPPTPQPAPPVPAPAPEPSFFEKYKTPILVIGAVLGAGVIAYVVSSSSRAMPNPRRRPPKKWMRKCVAGVKKGGSAADPGAVCGAQWYHKMSPKQRRAAKRKSYGR